MCEDCDKKIQIDLEAIKKSLMEYIDNYTYKKQAEFEELADKKLAELKTAGEQ